MNSSSIYSSDGTLGFNPFGGSVGGYSTFDDFSNGNGGNNLDWQSIINQGYGIASQAIAGWSNNPTQQIGPGGLPVGQGYSPAAIGQSLAAIQAATSQSNANIRNNSNMNNGGLGLDDAAGSITGFVQRNPLLVAGGAVALFLLMREPPRRR